LFEAARDHRGVEMAAGAGVDLHGAAAGRLDAPRVMVGFLVAFEHADRHFAGQVAERAFQ